MDDDLLLLIISSPSGAGKTTLTRDLLEHVEDLTFSVSHTTRKPRAGEVDGKDYHFVDRADFQKLVDDERFMEWAQVHDNLYGTAIEELDRCRRLGHCGIVFDIDYQGAQQIKAKVPSAVGIFILPPSMDELRARLQARASDDAASIERRFKNARREIEHYGLFDYMIVNDDLEAAKSRLRSIVVAERARQQRMSRSAESLLRTGKSGG